jgi:CBS-domain-containing membrane protein
MEALRLLLGEETQPTLLVVEEHRKVVGIVTKTDILKVLKLRRDSLPATAEETEAYQYNL